MSKIHKIDPLDFIPMPPNFLDYILAVLSFFFRKKGPKIYQNYKNKISQRKTENFGSNTLKKSSFISYQPMNPKFYEIRAILKIELLHTTFENEVFLNLGHKNSEKMRNDRGSDRLSGNLGLQLQT